MSTHQLYKFSITVKTDDLPVVYCLRALSKYCQRTGNNNIPWGGTNDNAWKVSNNCVTFRFSSPEYRSGFIKLVEHLLPGHLYNIVKHNDDDPAKPTK
jgi:hypothetical protein